MKLTFWAEEWPLARPFTISRGSYTSARVIYAEWEEEGIVGRGESAPNARYGESITTAFEALEAHRPRLERGGSGYLATLPPGSVRNVLDCAWWDWRAKREGRRVWEHLGWPPLQPVFTAYTLSVAPPEVMEAAAREAAHRPLLKIKTGGENVVETLEAVRRGAPQSRLIVDANEAWPRETLEAWLAVCAALGVEMVEQPLPADADAALTEVEHAVPVYADEAFHTSADVPVLAGRYDGVNIKLDKTGGLSEALRALEAARAAGLGVMCGCMLGTSLAMAPGMVIAQRCGLVDLDAPLLLARDRPEGLCYNETGEIAPFEASLWG